MPTEDSSEKEPYRRKHRWPRRYQLKKGVIGLSAFINAYHDEQKANRKQDAREDRVKRNIEIATLLFVILTTAGIFWQACILHNSDTTFKETLASQRNSSERQLRAHILYESVNITPGGAIFVRFKNSGQTPAYNLTHWWKVNVFYTPGVRQLEFEETTDASIDVGSGGTFDTDDRKLLVEEIQLAQRGVWNIYVWGIIKYRDVFQRCQFVQFALRSSPQYDDKDLRFRGFEGGGTIASDDPETDYCKEHHKHPHTPQAIAIDTALDKDFP